MHRWVERFQSHPVWGLLLQLEQLTLTIRSYVESDIESLEQLERISYFTNVVHNSLKSSDPLLVSPEHMTTTQGVLQSIYNELNAYQSNRNKNHLSAANTHIDNSLSILPGFKIFDARQDFEELRDSAASYIKSVSQLARDLQEQASNVSADIKRLQERIFELTQESSAQKDRIDSTITQFRELFSSAQESRQKDYSSLLEQHVHSLSDHELSMIETFQSLVSSFESKFTETMATFERNNKLFSDNTAEQSGKILSQISTSKEHAEKLVGIITATGMVHGYQATANDERYSAKRWRWMAVGSIVSWIITGLIIFALTYKLELNWAIVARQLLISTPFLLLAGFSALQVSQHQRSERANRRTELAIASIDPFLATLTEEERNDVKRSLVDQLFGQHDVEARRTESKKILNLISELAKTIQQIQGAIKR